jgi:hypothetical protein
VDGRICRPQKLMLCRREPCVYMLEPKINVFPWYRMAWWLCAGPVFFFLRKSVWPLFTEMLLTCLNGFGLYCWFIATSNRTQSVLFQIVKWVNIRIDFKIVIWNVNLNDPSYCYSAMHNCSWRKTSYTSINNKHVTYCYASFAQSAYNLRTRENISISILFCLH